MHRRHRKNPSSETSASLEEAERRLFREAMRDVRRIMPDVAPPPPRPRPRPRARMRRLDEAAVLTESLQPGPGDVLIETGEEVAFRRTGIQERVLRQLKRGEFRVEAEIDLHGLNVSQAKVALREFLQSAVRSGIRCVRIIHGKGRRSGHRGPVLKSAAQVVLQRTDAVLAYASARPVDGGTGALYVLLRSMR